MQQKLTQASKEAEAKSNPEGVVKKKKKMAIWRECLVLSWAGKFKRQLAEELDELQQMEDLWHLARDLAAPEGVIHYFLLGQSTEDITEWDQGVGGRQQEGVGEWKGLESPKVQGDWEIDEKKKQVAYWITKNTAKKLERQFSLWFNKVFEK